MSKKFRFKRNWKSILCGVLVVVTLIGACAGLAAIFNNDTKTIGSSAFERGALDINGEYVETKQSLYTKEAFRCTGLRIEPDFEAQLTYDVFYFDENDNLINTKYDLKGVYDEDFPFAYKARVVIHPNIPEGVDKNDFEIGLFEIYSYASKLTITVDKDQKYKYGEAINLYNEGESGKIFKYEKIGDTLITEDSATTKTSGKIVIGDYEKYDIFVKRPEDSDSWAVAVVAATETNKVLRDAASDLNNLKPGEWCKMEIDVSDIEDAAYLIVRMPINAECSIFGYNQ